MSDDNGKPYWMEPAEARERTRLWSQTSRRARRVALLCEAIASHERGRNEPHEASRSTGLRGSTVHYVRGRPVFT